MLSTNIAILFISITMLLTNIQADKNITIVTCMANEIPHTGKVCVLPVIYMFKLVLNVL